MQRRVKLGLLPEPQYFGTRFPRWDLALLEANDKRIANRRLPNVGALAAAKAHADKKAGKKADKPKPPAKPKPKRKRRQRAVASPAAI